MRSGWPRLLVFGGFFCGACAASSGSGTRPEGPPQSPAAEDEATTEESSDEESISESSQADSAEPAQEDSVDIGQRMVERECEALCVKSDETCSKEEASRCRTQCKEYVEKSAGCEVPYKAALKCQAKSPKKDLCANVESSTCAEPFRRIERCKELAAEEAAKAKKKQLPAGWKAITDDQLHITVALPGSAKLDPNAERRTWLAKDGGIDYVVAQLPAPGKEVTSKELLKLVLEFVGYSCQKNLKLHGQFEVKNEVAIRMDTQCKDGTEWHGMVRAAPDQAVVTAFHGPLADGVLEPFIYSYKRLK